MKNQLHTKKLFAGILSMTALPPKNPRPRGLYGTIPIPSSLYSLAYILKGHFSRHSMVFKQIVTAA